MPHARPLRTASGRSTANIPLEFLPASLFSSKILNLSKCDDENDPLMIRTDFKLIELSNSYLISTASSRFCVDQLVFLFLTAFALLVCAQDLRPVLLNLLKVILDQPLLTAMPAQTNPQFNAAFKVRSFIVV